MKLYLVMEGDQRPPMKLCLTSRDAFVTEISGGIHELDLELPDLPAVLEDFLAAGQAAVDHIRGALGSDDRPGSDSAHVAAALSDALQMMRLAAIWQGRPADFRNPDYPAVLRDKLRREIEDSPIIPEPGSRAAAAVAGATTAREWVDRWEQEWLNSDSDDHWGMKIEWGTARRIADRLDGAMA